MRYFDKTFFKFLIGFLLIISVSVTIVAYARGSYIKSHESGVKTYTDPEGVFSFKYPLGSEISGRDGALLAELKLPRSNMPKTNFSEAKLTINWSNQPTDINNCSGRTDTSDAGAGNFYETTVVKKIYDGDCYSFEYTIHSTNIQNYDPSQGIKEFDKAKIKSDLESVISSFKYLVNSD